VPTCTLLPNIQNLLEIENSETPKQKNDFFSKARNGIEFFNGSHIRFSFQDMFDALYRKSFFGFMTN